MPTPASATATLGVIGRRGRDVTHVDDVEFGDVHPKFHRRGTKEHWQFAFAEAILAIQAAVSIQNARLIERLATTARTVPLTGVANRRQFEDVYEREWRRALRARGPIALLMIDIDEFKKYNDRYGHQGGDQVLVPHRPGPVDELGRERSMLRLIASGKIVSEIARELSLSVKTISTYRTRILEKMGLRNNAELMHYAMQHQLVE